MCSRVRTQAVKKFNLVDVELTYESGCDCNNMANWLNTSEGRRVVRQKEFLLISLGTNDVARYGVDEAIQRCGELVCFIRRSCQGIRAIGWLALSPRWKPTRYVSAEEFGELHYQFNERLRLLSKQLDFDVVDACLGPEDMRVEDGLHPSTTTGRWKYEEAIREWFTSHAVARHSSLLQRSRPPTHSNSDDDLRPLMPPRQQRQPTIVDTTNNRPVPSPSSSSPRPSNNSTQPFSVTTDKTTEQLGHSDSSHQFRPSYPTKALIGNYPHKLRAIEQYYREHQLPQELEKDKNKVFLAANLYYQSRHFQEEAKKWEIYKQVASRDENKANDLEELPLARPSRERHQHILDITLSSDSEPRKYNNDASQSSSNSELDQEEPKKRKLHDTSLSPTTKENANKATELRKNKKKEKSKKKKKVSIEQDPRAPVGSPVLVVTSEGRREAAVATSVASPSSSPTSPVTKRQCLYSHVVRTQRVVTHVSDSSPDLPRTPPGLPQRPPAISPRQSTPQTPVNPPRPLVTSPPRDDVFHPRVINEQVEPMEHQAASHLPSVVRKDSEIIGLVSFPIIPIECKFHFKTFNTMANAKNIASHQTFLEKKSAQAEKQLEQLLKQFSENKHSIVVEFVKSSVEPLIDQLNSSNQKRLDNLVLDQMSEQAVRTMRNKCSQLELGHIEKTREKFERSLELKFQLDKLDRRLNENMPPPSLNVIDKLQFRSNELPPDTKAQYSEQWNAVLRKAKLELTSIMRLAKTTEIAKSEKEHSDLVEQIPVNIRTTYRELVHTIQIRQDKAAEKKLHFLDRRAQRTTEK